MKRFKIYNKILSLMLCLVLFVTASAAAYADDTAPEGVLDPDAMEKLVEDFIAQRGIRPENFSIGYVYTATGEEWYYNGDTWYYPASMYKVPLMMRLAEKVSSGEITQDTDLGGYDVSVAEEYIISYSNNDYAHNVRKYLGGDEVWRQEAKGYAQLEESEYNPDYMDYCYFSPRYITQVVKTLYNEPERFPNIIECMLAAEPTHFFRLNENMNASYDIAQKYGSFCDSYGDNFNHNTGIIYTPQPFILTVMTLNVSNYEKVISDAAVMFTDYTLSLEQELVEYEQEQEKAAQEKAEAERIAAEEKAAQEKAEAERIAAQKSEAEALAEAESRADARRQKLTVLGAAAGLVLLLVILLSVLISRRRKRRRYEEFERRFQEELARSQRRGRY